MEAASSYCTLEYDAEKGARGSRTARIEELLAAITGCQASLVVNNNAAAVLLTLLSVACGGNVIVSRGELVEIGGGFRVPDIMAQCGCTLREVGTTNKTRLRDYEGAIDADTRALLKVHPSNFKISGFTEAVPLKELAELGRARGIPVIEDIGSGALADMRRYGIFGEPLAAESLRNGADIVSFSGDKLLGGPQCGVVLGREKYVSAMKKHPLYRALRTDKMTIAALEATLRVYADPIAAEREIPVLSMLSQSDDTLRSKAEKLCGEIIRSGGSAEVVRTKSVAGGGAVPGLELDSYAIAPKCQKSASAIERELRALPVPIIGHIEEDRLKLDVRTIFEEDFGYIADAVAGVTK
jgi:L-seryl-tRNA(Ser) seleniumtransferase